MHDPRDVGALPSVVEEGPDRARKETGLTRLGLGQWPAEGTAELPEARDQDRAHIAW
jgi:hypothetical protein